MEYFWIIFIQLFIWCFLWYHLISPPIDGFYPEVWWILWYFVFFTVGRNVVLNVHILALKVGPYIFHSPTLVLTQCTILLPSLWLLCIYLLVMLSGVGRALFPNILPLNHQLPRWNLSEDFCVYIVPGFCLRGVINEVPGVLLGHHVLLVLLVGVHTSP